MQNYTKNPDPQKQDKISHTLEKGMADI